MRRFGLNPQARNI